MWDKELLIVTELGWREFAQNHPVTLCVPPLLEKEGRKTFRACVRRNQLGNLASSRCIRAMTSSRPISSSVASIDGV